MVYLVGDDKPVSQLNDAVGAARELVVVRDDEQCFALAHQASGKIHHGGGRFGIEIAESDFVTPGRSGDRWRARAQWRRALLLPAGKGAEGSFAA